MLWIFCRIFCRSLCQGFEFLFGRCSPKCAFRGPEVQKERPREPPRRHFSEPFDPRRKQGYVFSEFVLGSLFETCFTLFLKIWRPSNFEGNPFKAKTYWHLEMPSFFQFGSLFRKSAFLEFQDSNRRAPGSSQEALQHLSFYRNCEIMCFSKLFYN